MPILLAKVSKDLDIQRFTGENGHSVSLVLIADVNRMIDVFIVLVAYLSLFLILLLKIDFVMIIS